MGNIANSAGSNGQMQGNIYSHGHYQTNNSNNSTKRAIQGMKMHIWAHDNSVWKEISEIHYCW